jgi:hypothetical protein
MGTTLAEGSLSFGVSNLSASFENSNEMTIFDTLTLGSGMNQWLIIATHNDHERTGQ